MLTVKPFKAYRPTPEYAAKIAALPYDVMNTDEAREMTKDNPLSFLHVDKAEIDLPIGTDPHSNKVYEKANSNLNKLISDGYMSQDDSPCFYLYRLTMNGVMQTGIVACPSVNDYMEERIKKHELTRADKEADRIRHVDTLNANTGPIFLAHKSNISLEEIKNEVINSSEPVYDFMSDGDVRHEVWIISDNDIISKITGLFESMDSLYIADGHHRCASAIKVAQMRRNQFPNYTGNEEFNSFLAVLFPEEQLRIFDYNRAVKDLNGHSIPAFFELVSERFDIEEADSAVSPDGLHTFGMFLDGKWYKLTAHKDIYPCAQNVPGADADPDAIVAALDVAILQKELLSPILGIEDPRKDERIDFIGGIRGLDELERRASSDMQIAFSMYPTSMTELMQVADAKLIMPPKSTWFEPKLLSGLFIHKLD